MLSSLQDFTQAGAREGKLRKTQKWNQWWHFNCDYRFAGWVGIVVQDWKSHYRKGDQYLQINPSMFGKWSVDQFGYDIAFMDSSGRNCSSRSMWDVCNTPQPLNTQQWWVSGDKVILYLPSWPHCVSSTMFISLLLFNRVKFRVDGQRCTESLELRIFILTGLRAWTKPEEFMEAICALNHCL